MSAPTIKLTGKILGIKHQPTGNGQTLYAALLVVPKEGRERKDRHYKLTTFSKTDVSMLGVIRDGKHTATIECEVHGRYNKAKELVTELIPINILETKENDSENEKEIP